MNKRSTRQARVPGIITRLLDAVDQRAFRSDDARAADRGWQVSRPRRFTRRYRDPRWDLVSECPICSGEGMIGARTCPMCDGNGRVWTDPHGDEHERAS